MAQAVRFGDLKNPRAARVVRFGDLRNPQRGGALLGGGGVARPAIAHRRQQVFVQGLTYSAGAVLSFLEPPALAKMAMEQAGFSDVEIWARGSEPTEVSSGRAAESWTHVARAVRSGPTGPAELPPQVTWVNELSLAPVDPGGYPGGDLPPGALPGGGGGMPVPGGGSTPLSRISLVEGEVYLLAIEPRPGATFADVAAALAGAELVDAELKDLRDGDAPAGCQHVLSGPMLVRARASATRPDLALPSALTDGSIWLAACDVVGEPGAGGGGIGTVGLVVGAAAIAAAAWFLL